MTAISKLTNSIYETKVHVNIVSDIKKCKIKWAR